MVNTKHDTQPYEATPKGERCYQREIYDANLLYESFLRARKGSDWKPQVQQFEMNLLPELSKLQNELKTGKYEFKPTSEFMLRERGRTRYITGEHIHDRVAKHAICDEIIMPSIEKYLIYDNTASQTNKGIRMARERLDKHLRHYYLTNHSNDGYILLIDYSKYYDNIRHDELIKLFRKYVNSDAAIDYLEAVIDRLKVDVSYMTDEEYNHCMDELFNSVEYSKISKSLLTGEKFMSKGMSIGCQAAQAAGIIYPIRVDNYVKIVRSVKGYGRYMDDSYAIDNSKSFLEDLLAGIVKEAEAIGITVNQKKTRICKLSDTWPYLQVRYSLTSTGRIIKRIEPKKLTAMRRKMKKLVPMLTENEFSDWYSSWMGGNYKLMSKKQRLNMNITYNELLKAYFKKGVQICTRLN